VSYIDAVLVDGFKIVKVKLYDIWDGEKVQFDDEDNTIVRTTRWLHKIKN